MAHTKDRQPHIVDDFETKLTLTHLNINGRTESNKKLRNELLNTINSNVILVNEAHLPGKNEFMPNSQNFLSVYLAQPHYYK